MKALLLSESSVPARAVSDPSNDNPFSEAQFKTLKYHSSFPARFGSLEDARAFCGKFLRWYNTQHRHTSLRTPDARRRPLRSWPGDSGSTLSGA